jgi:hypothetical protein
MYPPNPVPGYAFDEASIGERCESPSDGALMATPIDATSTVAITAWIGVNRLMPMCRAPRMEAILAQASRQLSKRHLHVSASRPTQIHLR